MEERITGVMIYYYFVCKRKLWYFCHDIQMENVSQNENVQLGKYEFGYPPVTIDDVYKEVLEQAENFKKYAQ